MLTRGSQRRGYDVDGGSWGETSRASRVHGEKRQKSLMHQYQWCVTDNHSDGVCSDLSDILCTGWHAEVTHKHQAHGEWAGLGEAKEVYWRLWTRGLVILTLHSNTGLERRTVFTVLLFIIQSIFMPSKWSQSSELNHFFHQQSNQLINCYNTNYLLLIKAHVYNNILKGFCCLIALISHLNSKW